MLASLSACLREAAMCGYLVYANVLVTTIMKLTVSPFGSMARPLHCSELYAQIISSKITVQSYGYLSSVSREIRQFEGSVLLTPLSQVVRLWCVIDFAAF